MRMRRDTLLKLAKAGKLVAVGSYYYDEMSGESRDAAKGKPVRVAKYGDFKDGAFNVMESDFSGSCGAASVSADGKIVTLYAHSNCNYNFAMADGSSFAVTTKAPTTRRPENARMADFLAANGIDATPRYLFDGSLRGCWRLYNPATPWSTDLAVKLNDLGFTDYDGKPLGEFSGNGGTFMVFVRGHNELLSETVMVTTASPAPVAPPAMVPRAVMVPRSEVVMAPRAAPVWETSDHFAA